LDLNIAGHLALGRAARVYAGLLICAGGQRCGAEGNPQTNAREIRASVILFSLMMFPQFCRSAVVGTACALLLLHGLVSPRPPGVTHLPPPTVVQSGPAQPLWTEVKMVAGGDDVVLRRARSQRRYPGVMT
jgi:hypothetical protein